MCISDGLFFVSPSPKSARVSLGITCESRDTGVKQPERRTYNSEFICKNDKCVNVNFNSCFRIFSIDTIFTKSDQLKILHINNNPLNMSLNSFKKIKNTFNIINIFNDIFNIIENDDKNTGSLKLICKYDRNIDFDKIYYLSINQIQTYPEIIKALKKRNYTRSIWKKKDINIDMFLGYIIKNNSLAEDDKELYLNYLNRFLGNYNITNKISAQFHVLCAVKR